MKITVQITVESDLTEYIPFRAVASFTWVNLQSIGTVKTVG
jgi:hypothetical protein